MVLCWQGCLKRRCHKLAEVFVKKKKSLRWVRHPASELNAAVVALGVVDEHSACAQGGEGPLRIWGEDAIVSFPGAQASIIDERDAYMARTIRAAAQGQCARLAGCGKE